MVARYRPWHPAKNCDVYLYHETVEGNESCEQCILMYGYVTEVQVLYLKELGKQLGVIWENDVYVNSETGRSIRPDIVPHQKPQAPTPEKIDKPKPKTI